MIRGRAGTGGENVPGFIWRLQMTAEDKIRQSAAILQGVANQRAKQEHFIGAEGWTLSHDRRFKFRTFIYALQGITLLYYVDKVLPIVGATELGQSAAARFAGDIIDNWNFIHPFNRCLPCAADDEIRWAADIYANEWRERLQVQRERLSERND